MNCPACGKHNRPGAAFCHSCGTPLEAPAAAPPEPELPRVAGDRYIATAFLGRGGRKRVFRATDTRLDREVALSVIRTSGLDDASIERVRREAKAMARLGDHPNIVSIFDAGEEPDLIFLVAELMPGGSIDEQLAQANGPLPLDRVLSVARNVAEALRYVHEQGIVHRDIKPANVWLSHNGTAKLGDFGLATGALGNKLTSEGMMLGTVAYMAPEQATGSKVDARSDLYSLGALLYEASTGKPPFAGDDAIAVISQQINTAPVAPSWHNPQLPAALEKLILDLLAKSPDDRPQSASDVLERLAVISLDDTGVAEVQRPEDNPLDRLAAGVFVGRETESRELRLLYDAARSGSGGVALLVGEPGIGKTRLAEELLTYARMKGAQVLTGRCYEGEGAPAYWPWIQVIRSSVHDRAAAAVASEMGSGAGYIAAIVPQVRDVLPEVAPPAGSDLESSRFQLFDSVTTFLRNAARSRPLVVFLDDLHWADKPTLLLLEFLCRHVRDASILVVCTYRDIELGRQHPLAQSLATIVREPRTRRILLRGLEKADVARYLKLTSGTEPSDVLVEALRAETEGNPFFLIETVRLLASEGRLDGSAASSWRLTIPQGVKEVIGRRLDTLSAECNLVLTFASVLGRDFGLPALELLTGKPAEEVLEVLDEAAAARVITPTPSGWRFAHALIRETLYEELSTAKRLRLHKAAGGALERLLGDDADRALPELAHHYFEASALGEVDKAILYARRSGEQAMKLLAFEEAVSHFDRALQVLDLAEGGREQERVELLLAMGHAQVSSAEIAAAHRTFRSAFRLAREANLPELQAKAALGIGDVLTGVGSVSQELVEVLEEALAATAGQDSALRVRMLARLGEAYRFDPPTKHKEEELTREALAMARRVGNPVATTQALYARIIALGEGGETMAQIRLATELVETAKATGDIERRLLGLRLRMIMLFFTNRLIEARRDVEEYRRLADEARLPLYRWFSPIFESTWSFAEGRLEEAAELVDRGVAEGQKAGDPNALRFSIPAIVSVAAALRSPERLKPLMEELSDPASFRWLWGPKIAAAVASGQHADARRMVREAVSDNFSSVSLDFGVLWNLGVLAGACQQLGDASTAGILYDMAIPYSNRLSVPGYLFSTNGCGHHHLGVLATVLERYGDARYHLEAAFQLHQAAGFDYLAARTRLAQAQLFAARGEAGDEREHRTLLEEVRATALNASYPDLLHAAEQMLASAASGPSGAFRPIASEAPSRELEVAPPAASDGTVTILFTDIESSTSLNEQLGDKRWLELLRMHDAIVRAEVAKTGGTVVKSRGDGFMLAFPSARQALAAAISTQRRFDEHKSASPDGPSLRIRIGAHTGEVVKESGDIFGRHVNYASRIADRAAGGEILVSELTRALVQGSPEFRFRAATQLELKGFPGMHAAYPLIWSDEGS
ncbi:MAG TPA: protein kinase [Actinomycetota bacterium]|nr:protein kinase [Actinomycetota bacterium]